MGGVYGQPFRNELRISRKKNGLSASVLTKEADGKSSKNHKFCDGDLNIEILLISLLLISLGVEITSNDKVKLHLNN